MALIEFLRLFITDEEKKEVRYYFGDGIINMEKRENIIGIVYDGSNFSGIFKKLLVALLRMLFLRL